MKTPKRRATGSDAVVADTVRASISFPQELYQSLETLAKQKKVSLAWIVRDAAEMYVAEHANVVQGGKAAPLP
jgi:metal-responsive CopG/Arc/MetJ family transcriptional regulator